MNKNKSLLRHEKIITFTANSMVMVYVLGNQHSVLNQFIYEMRDASIQIDSLRFRTNMERASIIFAYLYRNESPAQMYYWVL